MAKKKVRRRRASSVQAEDSPSDLEVFAKIMALHCVRNTFLETLHAGISPSSKTGDFTDVKVVTPYGEIQWDKVSRISNDEMKRLMKEVVNKIFTLFKMQGNKDFTSLLYYPEEWDRAEIDKQFAGVSKKSSV